MQFSTIYQSKGSSLTFSAQGGRGKEKKLAAAKNSGRPNEGAAERKGLGEGILPRLASRPAGRRANPPEADIVGNSTSVEWGRSGVKSGLGFWRVEARKASKDKTNQPSYPFIPR